MRNFEKTQNKSLVSNNYVSLARFGGINKLTKQKNNYKNNSEEAYYHSAPEKYGFYAFISPYIEPFLLGGVANGGKGRINEFGKPKACKKFKAIDGLIWTHLKPHKRHMVVAEYGGWYKVHVKDLAIILKKSIAETSGYAYAYHTKEYNGDKTVRCGLTIKSPYALYSKDDMEVFICRETIIS